MNLKNVFEVKLVNEIITDCLYTIQREVYINNVAIEFIRVYIDCLMLFVTCT